MNDAAADSPAHAFAGPDPANTGEGWPVGPKRGEGWTRQRLILLAAFIFALHIAFIFVFGAKKSIASRPVINVPKLQLANSDELLALNDPTLFALPNPRDFASAVWSRPPVVKQPSFRWAEEPRWLPLPAGNLGAMFSRFMETNYFAGFQPDFKPAPKLSAPALSIEPALAQASALQIAGDLAGRRLLDSPNLPSLSYNDVIAPSEVQALVDAAGNVVSVVLLAPSGFDDADRRALELARTARFAPAPRLTVGRLIFKWHTVPAATTTN